MANENDVETEVTPADEEKTSQHELSMATELDESMPITEQAAEDGA